MKEKLTSPLKKFFGVLAVLVATLIVAEAKGGQATVGWDLYSQPAPSTNSFWVDSIQVFAAPGSNFVFNASNSNAALTNTVPVTVNTVTLTNLAPGWWTFTAVALVSTNNVTSVNSTNAVGLTPLGAPQHFRVLSTGP